MVAESGCRKTAVRSLNNIAEGFAAMILPVYAHPDQFTIGIYSVVTYTWILVLMALAIRQTQGLGRLPAVVTAVVSFAVALFLFATFVR